MKKKESIQNRIKQIKNKLINNVEINQKEEQEIKEELLNLKNQLKKKQIHYYKKQKK